MSTFPPFKKKLKKLLLGHLIWSLHLLAEMHYPKQYTPDCLIGNGTLAENSNYIFENANLTCDVVIFKMKHAVFFVK
jgi:hypothetical protein